MHLKTYCVLTWLLKSPERADTTTMSMRLPSAVVIKYRACSTDFILSGAYRKKFEKAQAIVFFVTNIMDRLVVVEGGCCPYLGEGECKAGDAEEDLPGCEDHVLGQQPHHAKRVGLDDFLNVHTQLVRILHTKIRRYKINERANWGLLHRHRWTRLRCR